MPGYSHAFLFLSWVSLLRMLLILILELLTMLPLGPLRLPQVLWGWHKQLLPYMY